MFSKQEKSNRNLPEKDKLAQKVAEIDKKVDFKKMTKIVSGKKLWNYDNLEPSERKGAI